MWCNVVLHLLPPSMSQSQLFHHKAQGSKIIPCWWDSLVSQHRRSVPTEAAAHRVADVCKLSSNDNVVAGSLFLKASPFEASDIAQQLHRQQHRKAQSWKGCVTIEQGMVGRVPAVQVAARADAVTSVSA